MPRDLGARFTALALVGAMLLTLSTCGQGEDLAGSAPAALRVTTATSGTGTDSDGYTVSIDGRLPVPIAPADTLLDDDVPPGEHNVDLGGVSGGCAVQGGGIRTLIAEPGTTASADFMVVCTELEAPLGTVLVVVTTSGVALDPDGYVVAVDPSYRRAIGVTGEVRLDGIGTGQRNVGLTGLAANCSVQGQNPRPIEVPPNGEVATTFAVRCWPPPSGRIAFVRSSSIQVIGADGTFRQTFSFSGFGGAPSWSPGGEFLAWDDRESGVVVQPLFGGAAVELAGCRPSALRPIWSPEGDRILCLSEAGELSSVLRDGSKVVALPLEGDVRVTGAHYLPDGRIFLVAEDQEGSSAVFRIEADGSALTRLLTLPTGGWAVPSPDGRRLAYRSFDLDEGRFELTVANLGGTSARVVSRGLEVSDPPVWSPDGSQLAFPDFGERRSSLWLVDSDGADLVPVPLAEGFGFDWSPDGTRLVFAGGSDGTNDPQSSIYTVRADGSGLERLTVSAEADMNPIWGP